LPDSKTGKKPIYLSAASLTTLSALPRIEGNPFVIPGEKAGQPRVDLKRPWAAVTKAAGLDGVRIHDLRHSFASVGAGASLGRQAAWALPALDNRSLCASRRRPDAARGRGHRRDHNGGNGRRRE
jgi:integrase